MSALGSNISWGDIQQQQARGNWKVVTMIDEETQSAGGDIYSAGEDVSLYSKLTLEVVTTDNCTVYYQTSNDKHKLV